MDSLRPTGFLDTQDQRRLHHGIDWRSGQEVAAACSPSWRMDRSAAEDRLEIARSPGCDTSGMAWPEQSGAIYLAWQP